MKKIPLSEELIAGLRKKYTYRKIGELTGKQSETIRYYFKQKEMPEYVYLQLKDLLPDAETKRIWVRMGVSIQITELELFRLMEQSEQTFKDYFCRPGFDDVDLSEREAAELMPRAVIDGESYIPGCCLDEYKDWYQAYKEKMYANHNSADVPI